MCAHPKTKGLLAGAEEFPADGLHPMHGAVLVRELRGVLDARDLAVEALVEDNAPIFRHLQLGVLRVARVDVVARALSSSAVLHVTDARDDLLSLLVVLRGYMIQLPLDRALQRRCIPIEDGVQPGEGAAVLAVRGEENVERRSQAARQPVVVLHVVPVRLDIVVVDGHAVELRSSDEPARPRSREIGAPGNGRLSR